MKRVVLIFVVLLLCGSASVQAQIDDSSRVYDIVTDTNTFYLFSKPEPCFDGAFSWGTTPINKRLQEYVASDTVTVYGVAITFEDYYGLLPVNATNFHALLFKKIGISYSSGSTQFYEFLPVDTVTINRAHPRFCWFHYEDSCNKENEYTAPCYEFYFDTPQQINRIIDTFYVGRGLDLGPGVCMKEYGARYDNSLPAHIYMDGSSGQDVYDRFVLQDFYDEKRWGWAFPIIGFRCGPVPQLHLNTYWNGTAVLSWSCVEEGTLYNLRLVGEDGSDTSFITSNTTFTFTQLSDSVRYTAMVRKQCHYATSNYDTTVYGEWKTVSFGTTIIDSTIADTTGVDTVGIARPDVEGFSLVPNPTNGAVLLTAEADLTGVEVYTAAGVPFRRLPASGRTVRFDTSTWPAGTYLLEVSTARGTTTKRLVVTR